MPDLKDFPDVTQMAIPFFVVAILIEVFVIRYLKGRGDYETRDTTTSLLMGVGNVVGPAPWFYRLRRADVGLAVPDLIWAVPGG
jgi:hypothetical protein